MTARLVLSVGRVWIFLVCAACGPAVAVGPGDDGTTSSTDPGGSSEGNPTTTGRSDTSSAGVTSSPGTTVLPTTSDDGPLESGGSSSEEGGASFIDDPTGSCAALPDGVLAHCTTIECSLTAQDCPEDEGCRAWANDGGDIWNASRCVPIDPTPGEVGAPCSVEGSGVSGVDSCDIGLMCWNVGADTLEGECVAYCEGAAMGCEDSAEACVVYNDGYLPLCLPVCDPLGASCGEGEGCYPGAEDNFVCLREGVRAGLGSKFHPECPSGTFWASDEMVDGCTDEEPCCVPYCDTSEPSSCGVDVACVPLFDPSSPAFPELGFCPIEAP